MLRNHYLSHMGLDTRLPLIFQHATLKNWRSLGTRLWMSHIFYWDSYLIINACLFLHHRSPGGDIQRGRFADISNWEMMWEWEGCKVGGLDSGKGWGDGCWLWSVPLHNKGLSIQHWSPINHLDKDVFNQPLTLPLQSTLYLTSNCFVPESENEVTGITGIHLHTFQATKWLCRGQKKLRQVTQVRTRTCTAERTIHVHVYTCVNLHQSRRLVRLCLPHSSLAVAVVWITLIWGQKGGHAPFQQMGVAEMGMTGDLACGPGENIQKISTH